MPNFGSLIITSTCTTHKRVSCYALNKVSLQSCLLIWKWFSINSRHVSHLQIGADRRKISGRVIVPFARYLILNKRAINEGHPPSLCIKVPTRYAVLTHWSFMFNVGAQSIRINQRTVATLRYPRPKPHLFHKRGRGTYWIRVTTCHCSASVPECKSCAGGVSLSYVLRARFL